VNLPIIADKDRKVAMLFGMLDPTTFRHGTGIGETMTVRSVFIISPATRRADHHLPRVHRPQLRRDPARARRAAAVGKAPRRHAGELEAGR